MPRKGKVERPGKLLYTLAGFFLKPFSFFRFGFMPPRGAKKLEEPFLAICNHSSNFDFIFALLSLYPKRASTLTAAFFYNNKYLGRVLDAFHCIPREQFRADVASVRKMIEIAASGGSVLLFPEGEVSGTGRTDVFPESTARLLKRMGVNVYAIKLYGSYFAKPKWAAHKRRGRVRAELFPLLTAREVKELPPHEIYIRVRDAIRHDEYEWQELARVPFRAKKPAEGLERLLYKCPRCKAEFTLASADDRFFCGACGNAARMDKFGFLLPEDEQSVIYRHVSDWVEYQRACIREDAKK